MATDSEIPSHPLPGERILWRRLKDVRRAECRVRPLPHGNELRLIVAHPERGEDIVWSVLFRRDDPAELQRMSDGACRDFERSGWTAPEGPR